jgi:ubiquinone/menaquinone biosynthesis C-methylase UbiE
MLLQTDKNWDAHVVHAEEVARGAGFCGLRDRIAELAAPHPDNAVVDVGAGTGLLTLHLAPVVRRVWAVDIAPSMCDYLRTKAASAGIENVDVVVASAVSLPLIDGCADLVVSNYCLHHLDERGKRAALAEAHRVLRPGGRLVFGDMMFALGVRDARDRRVVAQKVRAMVRKGPAGVARLARNGIRVAARRWERPARADWWHDALAATGFDEIRIELQSHEGGIAAACRP